MLKFGRAALYERLLKEKDRQIDILAEQIDYLRAQLALAGKALPVPTTPVRPSSPEIPTMEVKPYVSDDELDAQALLEAGEISKGELPGVLEALGLAGDLTIDIPPLS